jgi:tetratricopeptide (TPR) repeat protein
LTPEEMQWQREKQAYPGMTPQEMQWQREKQVYPTAQTRPAPPPGMTPQERQWQQEKQGYGAGAAGLTPQERQWQQEKQAYPPTAPGTMPQERQSQQEKQGYPVPPGTVAPGAIPPNNRNTRPANIPPVGPPPYDRPVTVAQPPRRRSGGWVWFLIPLVLLLIAAAVVAFLLLVKPGSDNQTATATASVARITGTPAVTGGSTPSTPGLTGTPNTTPGVTTGGALNPGQLTATAQSGTSVTAGTNAARNEDLFNQGKSAFDNTQWLDAIAAWEKIDPNSQTYAKTKPLLATAYYNQANSLALNGNTADSLTQAIGYYNKASALAPDNADFRTGAENASFYQSGSKALSAQDWDTAVNLLSQLYSRNPDFRDTTLLYFNALVGQGDTQAASGNLVAAKDSYSTALGLTFKGTPPDTTALQAKLADVNAKLNPTPTASPSPSPTTAPTATPRPAPTATKKPAPTATPLAPCSKGGSGSNFFPFRTGQPPVPNVPDQGRSGVRGVVLDRNGAPIAGATIRIATNGHVFTSVTDGGGNYFREGLGRGTWTISVTAAPGRTICYGAGGTVMLSGESGFYGSVDFTESIP